MSNDDPGSVKSTVHSTVLGEGPSTSADENPSVEDWLFDLAARCHVPLRRLDGESVHVVANRLTLDLERRIALLLFYLDEIAQVDFRQDQKDAS